MNQTFPSSSLSAAAATGSRGSDHPLRVKSARYEPMRKITHPDEKIV